MAEQQDLLPDDQLLAGIFPNSKLKASTILAQTFDTCTCIAHLNKETTAGLAESVVVRLETSQGHLPAVAALQSLGNLVIPELVPKTLQIGKTKTHDGRELEYSVTEFISGTVVLESIWNDLDDDQQSKIMDSVIQALGKLYTLKPEDKRVQEALRGTEYGSTDAQLGGPNLRYSPDIKSFLKGIIARVHRKNPTTSLKDDVNGDGIIIESTYEDLAPIRISQEGLASLEQQTIFCHNDLEPRNILVRETSIVDGRHHYELAAIIDWEMAGFFPLSYEYGMKDSLLGSANLYYSWYALFKRHAAQLLQVQKLPQCQLLLMQALDLIHQSRKRRMTKNVGALVQKKWIEREQLVRGPNAYDGWIRKPDAKDIEKYTSEDNRLLEEEVLKELGYI